MVYLYWFHNSRRCGRDDDLNKKSLQICFLDNVFSLIMIFKFTN